MIAVKTYISVDQWEHSSHPLPPEIGPRSFIDIEDETKFEELCAIFRRGGSAIGSIVITYNGEVILPREVIDRLPLYWVILFDLLRNYILKIEHDDHYTEVDHYFAFIKLVDEIEIYCYYEDFIVTLPEKEFLLAALEGCRTFYRHYNKMFTPNPEYDYVKKAEELIEIVKRDF